jgi:hypothetical protein
MRPESLVAILCGTALTLAGLAARAVTKAERTFDFDDAAPDAPPKGFSFGRTGSGTPGKWVVRKEKDAPSGSNVLAQLDADGTDFRFPVAFADEPSVQNVRVAVKCKTISGEVDQVCGLVLRLKDENNYYIARSNALESNIRFYHVKEGKRTQLASWSGKVTHGAWHELAIEAKGDRFQVLWDAKKVLDVKDRTFSGPGRIGLWTKADAVTWFDDLSVTEL